MNGWLLAQLPRAMNANPLVEAFVDAAERIGDSIRAELDGLEYQLDPDLASPEMLAYLAGWLGFRSIGSMTRPSSAAAAGARPAPRVSGTKRAVAELLAELTGGPVRSPTAAGCGGRVRLCRRRI